jgi:hypothetical protein
VTEDHAECYQLDTGLSDREVLLIGQIIVQWGALEYEIFAQTLRTFDDQNDREPVLPNAMNNLQLTKLLDLWKERVVDQAPKDWAEVLRFQLDEITRLKDSRDALVHGMWHWSAAELTRISTVRVRRTQVITTHFTVRDLQDFADRVASINFKIRYPAGLEGFAHARAAQGGGISRMGLAILTGDRLSDDWLSTPPDLKNDKPK